MKKVLTYLIILLLTPNLVICQENWNVHLGQKTYVDINHLPLYRWIPDGHISVLPEEGGQYVMYWPEFSNSRTRGDSQFPEDQRTLDPVDYVFGGRMGNAGPSNGYNDGGSWLMSVFRHNESDTLIGFYHGESHWYPRNGDFTAWKSTCLAYSYDNGYTWEDKGQIITSNTPKPETRQWGGSGDCCVVWDSVNNRWNCYHQEHNIRLAVSYDPLGAPGSWMKFYNGEFNEEGLGGKSSPLSNLSSIAGSNPSVHWNTFYNKWVMVYYSWSGGIIQSLSEDGINWETPKKIVYKNPYDVTQATIIGETDTRAGRLARLYYAEFKPTGRKMAARDILFDTLFYNHGNLPEPWESESVGDYNFLGKAGSKNDIIRVTGTTNNLFGQLDAFYYVFQRVNGNGEISSELTSQTQVNNLAYSGLMLRSSLDSGSTFISISRKSLSDTIVINYRDSEAQTSKTRDIETNNNWFKIRKEGPNIEVLISEDGISWGSAFSMGLELSTEFYAGLYTTNHDETNFCTATFENTKVNFNSLGIDIVNQNDIRIFPNPANDKLYIHLQNEPGLISYRLIDISGKIYRKGQLKEMLSEMDISHLPSNQYYIVQLFERNIFLHNETIFKK